MLRVFATALSLLILGGCGVLSAGTLDEVGDLITEGGERVLREPMRPIRGTTRVLVIALDGVGEVKLQEALDAGAMPQLAAFLGAEQGTGSKSGIVREHAFVARGVPSVFPSETAPGWAAVYTGATPAVSGVTGNEWFDRDSLATFAPVPLSVGSIEQTLSIWSDSLFSQVIQAPTVFEQTRLRSHVSMGFVYRGADVLSLPDLNDFGDLLEGAIGSIFGGADQAYEEIDDDTREGVKASIKNHGVADLQIAYFPGVDLVAHSSGPLEQRAYLTDEIDPHIGALLQMYREQGVLANTYVILVSDHGHTDVLDDDRHSLADGGRDEPPALLDSLGYRLRDFTISSDSSDANVVMIYDEAVAMLYLANGTACPARGDVCDWSLAPRLTEDVLPLARELRKASDSDTTGVGGLSGALDLIFVRASDPSGRTSPPYRVFHDGRVIPVAEYLRQRPRPDLIQLERRLGWLTDGPLGHRAGDILLLAKAGGERSIEERFYFGVPRVSGHGSASASDAHISLVLAREGASGADLRAQMHAAIGDAPTQLDVTDLILALLGE